MGSSRAVRRPFSHVLIPGLTCLAFATGCGSGQAPDQAGTSAAGRPNILFVVWDTVRADHLSLYGHERRTTPHLEEFAKQARVFEDCVSVGSTTVPAHAAMFTGLMPTEHGVTNEAEYLADEFQTLAELLRVAGYNTYLLSENPHICDRNNFTQGFDVAEHPWSPKYHDEALLISVRRQFPDLPESEVARIAKGSTPNEWGIKAAGKLVQKAVENWLAQQDADRPFFIFLNYMEAHKPLIPPPRYCTQMMTPEQARARRFADPKWLALWPYVFGLHEHGPDDIALINAAYDAALLELDDLFRDLLESLRTKGHLENTVVVLVGDHGEHLGEHHLLEHQFSVYEPLMRVPLVVYHPKLVPPGRESHPVTNLDLFPTLLELAGIDPPVKSKARSLFNPAAVRPRVGEYPAVMTGALQRGRKLHPAFDPTPFDRTLRAYYEKPYKFIQASDGHHELYQLDRDPHELHNLIDEQPALAQRLAADLQTYLDSLMKVTTTRPRRPSGQNDEDYRRRLEALGYLGTSEDASEDTDHQKSKDDKP
jgi:arylsulfatase A-like enzyme